MGREGGVEDWLVNSLSVSRLESKREEGRREGRAFRSKLMRGLALTARTLPPIPPNGLLGWKEMPPAVFPLTQNGLVTAQTLTLVGGLSKIRQPRTPSARSDTRPPPPS